MRHDYAKRAVDYVAARSVGRPLPPGARVTINFHPDVVAGGQLTLAALAEEKLYRSQFETGTSSGGLTAHHGGDRWLWEHHMFGGVYDEAEAQHRPKYGALNLRNWEVGGSPRFGSAHLRLAAHVMERTTFCYPDSHLHPRDFGVASAMHLIELFNTNDSGLDVLDNYIEAHIHGPLRMEADVEAVVLDPCYRSSAVEEAAMKLPCTVEWHSGFSLRRNQLGVCSGYRGQDAADVLAGLAAGPFITPMAIGALRSGATDPQLIKRAWHCVARFGASTVP